jgi:circadian clock protein KaiC
LDLTAARCAPACVSLISKKTNFLFPPFSDGKHIVFSTAINLSVEKCPTGIRGLDEITKGGLPRGRPTLICGSAGCGKTLFSMEFLARGAMQYGEPGVFMTFEETPDDLTKNFISLGFNLPTMLSQGLIAIDHVYIERTEIAETGEYDLEGLFIRLGNAIDSIGAKRVVLDTIEALFSGLSDTAIIRAELRRLFKWLKDRGVTAIVTGESGDKLLTRYGLEEYVADCVILLDFRIVEQISTRRLRIIKYRGSSHGADEYPFLIDERGISILPITRWGSTTPFPRSASPRAFSSWMQCLEAGVFPGQHRAYLRHGGHGQNQPVGNIRRSGLPAGRALPVFCI